MRPSASQSSQSASAPRTVILSDLHLGRPGGALGAAAFASIVGACDRVVVNGDIAELHHALYQHDANRELDRFRDLCASRGVRLDLIAGNHDPFVSEVRALTLADGAVYVTHGDALHPAIAPWSPYAASMRAEFERSLAAQPTNLSEVDARFLAARDAAIAEWRSMGAGAHVSTFSNIALRPQRIAAVVRYWLRYPRLAAAWAARHAPQAGTIVVGHSHRAFSRVLGGRRVVNTGAYGFPGTPHAVVLENGRAALHRIALEGRLYRLALRPIDAWTVQHCAPAADGNGIDASNREGNGLPSTVPMKRAADAIDARSSRVS